MLIENILCELKLISLAYEQITMQIQYNVHEIWSILKKNEYEEEYNAIEGFLTASLALNKSLKDLINEYQENINNNYSQLLKNEI